MNDVLEIRVTQDNVNDDAVFLRVWHVADGDRVTADQPLVEVETSKAAYDIPCPSNGILKLLVSDECEVPVGTLLGYVGESASAIEAFRASQTETIQRRMDPAHERRPAASQQESRAPLPEPLRPQQVEISSVSTSLPQSASATSTRISRKARELIQQRGLSEADFVNQGLVRTRDILEQIDQPVIAASPVAITPNADAPSIRGAAGVSVRSEAVSRIKRVEARLLSWSTQQALRSTVVTNVPTLSRQHSPETQTPEWRSVRLIHEVAQLLKKNPAFNAYCSGEQHHFYEQVNIGYALDAGHGLKVPVFRNADEKSPDRLLVERRQFVDDYLANTLRPESLGGGTFTITDLSGSGVLLFDPLIVEAQAAILGIGADHALEGGQSSFNLILSFDHRLVEGRAAARFVNELKERLLAQDSHLCVESTAVPCCAACGMTTREAATRKHYLVSVAGDSAGTSKLVCTICLSGR